MDEELIKDLRHHGSVFFKGTKCVWTQEDIDIIYQLFNRINGTSEVDKNCNNCRREKIVNVRDNYLKIKE